MNQKLIDDVNDLFLERDCLAGLCKETQEAMHHWAARYEAEHAELEATRAKLDAAIVERDGLKSQFPMLDVNCRLTAEIAELRRDRATAQAQEKAFREEKAKEEAWAIKEIERLKAELKLAPSPPTFKRLWEIVDLNVARNIIASMELERDGLRIDVKHAETAFERQHAELSRVLRDYNSLQQSGHPEIEKLKADLAKARETCRAAQKGAERASKAASQCRGLLAKAASEASDCGAYKQLFEDASKHLKVLQAYTKEYACQPPQDVSAAMAWGKSS